MKLLKYIIFILVMLLCTAYAEDYYRNVVPGVPVAQGKRLGGLWEREPNPCEHDQTQIQMMKEQSLKSASNWRKLAYISSIIAFGALLVWYLTKLSQAGGVAVISVIWSLFSTFMAVLVSTVWIIVLVVLAVALIGLGIWLHKKSFFEWIKEKKKNDSSKQRT